MVEIKPLLPGLDKTVAHDILCCIADAGGRKLDVFSISPACGNINPQNYLDFFWLHEYVDSCEVRVFGADFICYGLTPLGHEYLKWLS